MSNRALMVGVLAGVLVFSAVLLAPVSNARAVTYTYNIVSYPASQTDNWIGGADTISGTVTVSKLGEIDYNLEAGTPISCSSLAVTAGGVLYPFDPGVTYIGGVGMDGEPAVYATATQLLIPTGYNFALQGALSVSHIGGSEIGWSCASPGQTTEDYYTSNLYVADQVYRGWSNQWSTGTEQTGAGLIGPPTWVIGTIVPEPGTLTLLVSALLGLAGAAYLRRRGVKA